MLGMQVTMILMEMYRVRMMIDKLITLMMNNNQVTMASEQPRVLEPVIEELETETTIQPSDGHLLTEVLEDTLLELTTHLLDMMITFVGSIIGIL